MDSTNNPLLDFSGLPRFRDIRPEHVRPALDEVFSDNRRRREALLASVDRYTWGNFAQPLEDTNERLNRLWSPVSHLNAVMNNETLRAAYNENLPRISEYYTELAQDERLYAAYKTLAADPEFAHLSQAQKKIVENTLRDFRLAGAELNAAGKKRFLEIQKELSTLTSRFSENVLDATQAWELVIVDEKELAGLPETARAVARQTARQEGRDGWKFTLEGPSYLAFLTYADDRERRRLIYEAYVTRASECGPQAGRWDNGLLMARLLELRGEAARLLGFAHYAEYALQTRMARSVAQVMDFLRDLAQRARPQARKELEELRDFARARYSRDTLEAWDIPYYSEKLRQARYDISQEDVRPFLPENRVVPGMFEIVRRLYGLEVRQVEDVEVWHPDVRFYEIRDRHGAVRGRFYMDLYARPNKRGGAWMDECIHRKRVHDDVQIPVAYLTCNFSPPVTGHPALFTHEETTTLFHEFGHGLHHMLTTVDYVGVAGINGVAWDAVELPSQFMENWCWERAALDLIGGHHETGAPIPDDLYRKMIAARNFQSGMQFLRQLEFALFDMRLHSDFDPMKSHAGAHGSPPSRSERGARPKARSLLPPGEGVGMRADFPHPLPSPGGRGEVGESHHFGRNAGEGRESRQPGQAIQDLLDEVRAEVAVLVPPAFNRFQNSFTHIFSGGYAAGYYSYKWAEVLSADAFSKFEENGVFDRHTGQEFMRHILEPGGSREPLELFVGFRGREPRIDALLRHYGLAA
jgi:oligopeptidase A